MKYLTLVILLLWGFFCSPVSYAEEAKINLPPVAPGSKLPDSGFGQSYTTSMFISLFYKIYPNTSLTKALTNLEDNLQPLFSNMTLCFDDERKVLYLIMPGAGEQFVVYCVWLDAGAPLSGDPVFISVSPLPLIDSEDRVIRDIMGFKIKKYPVTYAVRKRMLELMFENNLPLVIMDSWTDIKEPSGKVSDETILIKLEEDIMRVNGKFILSEYRNCKVDKGCSEFTYQRDNIFSHEIYSWKLPAGITGQITGLQYLPAGRVFCLVTDDRGEGLGEEKRYRQSLLVWDITNFTYQMVHLTVSQEAAMAVLPEGQVLLNCDGQLYLIVPEKGEIADVCVYLKLAGEERGISWIKNFVQENKDAQKIVVSGKISGDSRHYLLRLDFGASNEEENVSGFIVPVDISALDYADSRRILLGAAKSVGVLTELTGGFYLAGRQQGRLLTQTEFCAARGWPKRIFAVSKMNRGLLLQQFIFEREMPEQLKIRMFAKNIVVANPAAVCLTERGTIIAGVKAVEKKQELNTEQEQLVELDSQLSRLRVVRLTDGVEFAGFSKLSENDGVLVAGRTDLTICLVDLDNERIKEYYTKTKTVALAELVKGGDIWQMIKTKLLESFYLIQGFRER